MKKVNLLLLSLFFISLTGKAQYTVLLNFDSINGEHPSGALTYYAHKLYGMSELGGANALGCIFRIDTDGNGYEDLLDFSGVNGEYPTGDLTIYGGKIFGMTPVVGGRSDTGCIFSMDTNGNNFKNLHYIAGTEGSIPSYGGLTLYGKVLYGMTMAGGSSSVGNIFSIDTNGNGYKDLFDFDGTNGYYPLGSLTYSAGVLYGTTNSGGVNNDGNIFSIDTSGINFKDMHDFNRIDGANPHGNLTLLGNNLYGMTYNGTGIDTSRGCIFSINLNGSGFKDMHFFHNNSDSGYFPTGSLVLSHTTLYGMASGGALGDGIIFKIDTNGNGYIPIFDFDETDGGGLPFAINTRWSALTINGDNLYGMTLNGGTDNIGVVFSLNYTTAGINEFKQASGELVLYPNPSNGIFNFKSSVISGQSLVEIYNMLGEKVYSQFIVHSSSFLVDLNNQPNGVYLYRVLSNDGGLIGEGKLVIQK